MPRFLVSIALLAALPLGGARAQGGPPAAPNATVLDLTGAAGPTLHYASGAAWRLWGLGAGGRCQAGLGVRVSHFFAGSYVLDRQTGPDDFLVEVPAPRLTALNAAFHVRARVAGPVRLGFNLDVAGVTVGPGRTRDAGGPSPANAALRPVAANLLLGGSRDRGSLNSEAYVAVALPHGLRLRAGLSHVVTAYESDAGRYRRFRNLAALGLSYQLL